MLGHGSGKKGQVALEFIVVYSFVLIIFILIFSLVTSQRAVMLDQQQYSLMQLQSQSIASYIDRAAQAGSGYSATVPLVSGFANNNYNVSVSTSGVVIADAKIGRQQIRAYGFSHARNLVINGTLQTNSNGILIYQIPTYKGSVTISNLKGTVYVDEKPPQALQIAHGAIITQVANTKYATFNSARMNFIEIPNSNGLTVGKSYSISLWFYANGCGTLVGKSKSAGFSMDIVAPCHTGQNANDILGIEYMGSEIMSVNVPSVTWINAVAVIDGVGGAASLYIDGNAVANAPITSIAQQNANDLYIGNGNAQFNGSIANLQVYNGILNSGQVMGIYHNGIGGDPINQEVVGWWPLNGDTMDYSGNGNRGSPVNALSYGKAIQLNANTYSPSDNTLEGLPIGFATSIGSFSGNSMYSTIDTDSNGVSTALITALSAKGSGNVIIDMFNGNVSTTGNLVGWWPLDIGYGSNVPDFGMSADTGTFNGKWTQYINQTNFISPNYRSTTSCAGNSGPYDSSLTLNSTPSLFNVVNNDTFTAVAWVYPTSTEGQRGIFGNWNGIGTTGKSAGFQLVSANNGNCAVMYVANSLLYFPSACNLPENTWEMVVGEYNGNTGYAAVYLDNTVIASGKLQAGLPLGINNAPYQIGYDLASTGSNANFNGVITNVQLYDSYLSSKQIGSLYREGLTTPPLSDSGLVGWWPLLNNENDYSYNNGNGTHNPNCPPGHGSIPNANTGNIVYINNAYNNTQSRAGPSLATFNGMSNLIIPYSDAFSKASGTFTVSMWFSDFNSSSAQFGQRLPLIYVGTESGNAYHLDINVCGTYACNGITGIQGSVGSGSGWMSTSVNYPFSFSKNTWYDLTEVFRPTGWTVYLNGINVSSGSYTNGGTPSFAGTGDNLYVGSAPGSGARFAGQIADLQVYDSALNQRQAMRLYVQGLPVQYKNNISVG